MRPTTGRRRRRPPGSGTGPATAATPPHASRKGTLVNRRIIPGAKDHVELAASAGASRPRTKVYDPTLAGPQCYEIPRELGRRLVAIVLEHYGDTAVLEPREAAGEHRLLEEISPDARTVLEAFFWERKRIPAMTQQQLSEAKRGIAPPPGRWRWNTDQHGPDPLEGLSKQEIHAYQASVREWAASAGLPAKARGWLDPELVVAYQAEHQPAPGVEP